MVVVAATMGLFLLSLRRFLVLWVGCWHSIGRFFSFWWCWQSSPFCCMLKNILGGLVECETQEQSILHTVTLVLSHTPSWPLWSITIVRTLSATARSDMPLLFHSYPWFCKWWKCCGLSIAVRCSPQPSPGDVLV